MKTKNFWSILAVLVLIAGLISTTRSVSALGTPQIVSVNPPSGSPVGSTVCIRAEVAGDSDFRSMRIKFGNEGWNESAEINFERCFGTGHLGTGWYKIRVEVAKVNEDWGSATWTEADYQLTQTTSAPANPPPPSSPSVSCNVDYFDAWPNPITIGESVNITGTGSCNTGVRAVKVKVDDVDLYEIGNPQLDTRWNTSGASAGPHQLKLMVAGQGDNNWNSAASQVITVQLVAPNQPPPPSSSPFKTSDIIDINGNIFVITVSGGAVEKHHVPNPDTLDALGIPRGWVNNRGFSNSELKAIHKGSDIPDVNRDYQGFINFKNKYFPNTTPIVPSVPNEPEAQSETSQQPQGQLPQGVFDPKAPGVCSGWITRLWIGSEARITNKGGDLKLRTGPSLSASTITKMPAGYKFVVIGGPKCVDGYTWWNIQGSMGTGWSAEVADLYWWMAPMRDYVPPEPTPVPTKKPQIVPTEQVVSPEVGDPSVSKQSQEVDSLRMCISEYIKEKDLVEKILDMLSEDAYASRGPFTNEKECVTYVSTLRKDSLDWLEYEAHAYKWDDMAKKNGGEYGVYVDNNPRPGDIVVWEKSCEGKNKYYGHVAYVTDVSNGNSGITVNERNKNGNGVVEIGNTYPINKTCMSFIHKPGGEPEQIQELTLWQRFIDWLFGNK